MNYADAIDSYYRFVKSRIIAINANREFVGIMSAQDWPPKNVTMEAFYLLDLDAEPVGRSGFSPAVPIKFHLVQWTWVIKGADLQQGIRAAFRGDRYRTMQTMKDELTRGMFPNYAEKLTWSLNANGQAVGASYTPQMFITWIPVKFHTSYDKDSGVAYGTASTRIQDILQPILA